jgi:hypothetical protein
MPSPPRPGSKCESRPTAYKTSADTAPAQRANQQHFHQPARDAAHHHRGGEGRRHRPTESFEQQCGGDATDQREVALHGVDDARAAEDGCQAQSDQSVDETVGQAGKDRLKEKARAHRDDAVIGLPV